MTNMINEELARRAKENMSFSDCKPGSATEEYNAVINDVSKKIEKAKKHVSPEAQQRLDNLLTRYATQYANWVNAHNRNGSNHVSIMISGASNYNMKAHEKYLKREGKLWEEYDELKNIDWKIQSIINGDKIIKSNDSDAINKLKEKLAKALEEHQGYKEYNAKARKEGKEQLMPYVLQNSNSRIKNIKDRIKHLERIAEKAANTTTEELTTEINGIQIIDNLELQRVQIIFPGKPDASIRTELKKNGFKWAPSQGAWQNYSNTRNLDRAKEIVNKAE